MNNVTKQIMEILTISAERASQVQHAMECDGFDFSECSDRQFKREVRNTFMMMGA
jgi:hypothetical protein